MFQKIIHKAQWKITGLCKDFRFFLEFTENLSMNFSGVRRKKFQGVQGRGSGGGASRTPDNVRKFAKKFLKKMAKNGVFSPILQKSFKTMRSIFARLDEKHNCFGNFEKILKIFDENSME